MNDKLKNQITHLIAQALPGSEVILAGQDCNCQATVVSSAFSGLNKVKRQQIVYQALQDLITSGELHAISLQTLTPDEWSKQNG